MADGDPPIPPPSSPFHDTGHKPSSSQVLNLKTYSIHGKVSEVLLSDQNPFKTSVSKSILPQNIVAKSSSTKSESFYHGLSFGLITVQNLASSGFAGLVGVSFSSDHQQLPSASCMVADKTPPHATSSHIPVYCLEEFQSPSDSKSAQKLLPPAANSNTSAPYLEITLTPSVSNSAHKLLSTATTSNTTASFTKDVKSPNDSKSVQVFEKPDLNKDVSFCPNKDSGTPTCLKKLPYMLEEAPLLAIANTIGTPLCVDPLFINRDDVSKKTLEGFWVKVFYEVVPPFCSFGLQSGQELQNCISRTRKQGDVSKVFDKLTQSVTPTVLKVIDSLPQSAESSTVLGSLGNSCALDVGGLVELPDAGVNKRGPEQNKVVQQRSSASNEVSVITANNTQIRISTGKISATGFQPHNSSVFQPAIESVTAQGSAVSAEVSEGSAAAIDWFFFAGPSMAPRKEWVCSRPRKEWVFCCHIGYGMNVCKSRLMEGCSRQFSVRKKDGSHPADQPTTQVAHAQGWKEKHGIDALTTSRRGQNLLSHKGSRSADSTAIAGQNFANLGTKVAYAQFRTEDQSLSKLQHQMQTLRSRGQILHIDNISNSAGQFVDNNSNSSGQYVSGQCLDKGNYVEKVLQKGLEAWKTEATIQGCKAVKTWPLKNVALGGKQKINDLQTTENKSTVQFQCSASMDQVSRIGIDAYKQRRSLNKANQMIIKSAHLTQVVERNSEQQHEIATESQLTWKTPVVKNYRKTRGSDRFH